MLCERLLTLTRESQMFFAADIVGIVMPFSFEQLPAARTRAPTTNDGSEDPKFLRSEHRP